MRRIVFITAIVLSILLLSLFTPLCAHAYEESAEDLLLDKIDVTAVENAAGDTTKELGGVTKIASNTSGKLNELVDKAVSALPAILRTGVKNAAVILVISIFCGLADTLFRGGTSRSVPDTVSMAGCLAITAFALTDMDSCLSVGKKSIEQLCIFSKAVLPTLSSVAALGGYAVSSGVKYAASALFLDLLLTLSENVIVPLIYAYTATIVAECAFGGNSLSGISAFLKWLTTTVMTVVVLAFIFYLSISGIVSGTADAANIRLAKTTLSSTLPVVGGIVSDAASSVLTAASSLKSSIGIFGMLSVVAICLIPFLRIGVSYLLFKAASRLIMIFSSGRIPKLTSGLGSAFGLIVSMTGVCAIMTFFSLLSLIKTTGV
ncbi:MAG: hypothetical protein GXY20_08075 [Clostridiales bacterium]|nr:hypothetical protein [Clostridiales bacterium]